MKISSLCNDIDYELFDSSFNAFNHQEISKKVIPSKDNQANTLSNIYQNNDTNSQINLD